jgi:hypothetical protein
MKRLLFNADQHIQKFGFILISIYPQGNRRNKYTVKAKSIEIAKNVLCNCINSLTDEVNIPHINLIVKQ